MSGVCDRCQRPGRCCSGIMLNGGDLPGKDDWSFEQLLEWLRTNPQLNVNGDTETLRLQPMWHRPDGKWQFWCDAWQDGRCSIYSHRPKMCKDYAPQTDELCWHFDIDTAVLIKRMPSKGVTIDLLRDIDPASLPQPKNAD